MSNDKLNFFLIQIILLFFCRSSNAYQLGIQYQSESTYRNTFGPYLIYPIVSNPHWDLQGGSTVLFSNKDWEVVSNRLEAIIPIRNGIKVGTRLGHRVQLPEPFSRTSALGYIRWDAPSMGPVSFYFLGGWYYRFVQLDKVSIVPFVGRVSFSQQDFCTNLGFNISLTSSTSWKLALSTMDEMEVYNLNHPFIESSWGIVDPISQSQWLATIRSQVLLGFGRIDRLVFGLSYLKNL